MSNELLEILSLMDIKAIPKVAAYHHTAKAPIGYLADIVEADAAKRIDVAIDEALSRGFLQLFLGK